MALDAAQKAEPPVFTYGPLIHNPSALMLLEARGVHVLEKIPDHGHGTVIIRAHGVCPDDKARILKAGFKVLDATCPRVIKVQMLARHYAGRGLQVLLVGDRGHPEVLGIMGYAGAQGTLIANDEDLRLFLSGPDPGPYILLAQTTQDQERFARWSRQILDRFPGGKVFNTICNSTHKRQAEVKRLASETDAVVVVGGKQSANTHRLAEIVVECGKTSIPVETEDDLDREALANFRNVGITAGASTPNWVINRIVREIQSLPGAHEPVWYKFMYRLVRFLHETNLLTALAGGVLAWASAFILEARDSAASFLSFSPSVPAAFCYIYAMHTLNRLIDRKAGEFNDPLRAKFMARHRMVFVLTSLAAMSCSMLLAWVIGMPSFILLVLLSLFGVLYAMPILPGRHSPNSLRNLPGSKTLFVSLAWAAVCVLAVPDKWPSEIRLDQWMVFFLVGTLVYLRTALLEVLDVQGDRIVGRETLAVLIGEKRVVRFVTIMAWGEVVASIFSWATGLLPARGLILAIPSLYMIWLSKRFLRGRIGQNLRLESLVEGSFFLLLIPLFFAVSAALCHLFG